MSTTQPQHQLAASRVRCRRSCTTFAAASGRSSRSKPLGGAAFGVLVGYLAVYALDRVLDTPAALRAGHLPRRSRRLRLRAVLPAPLDLAAAHLDQLARLLSRRHPSIGDQMLGIIELVRSEFEQARSPALCQAAIEQVAEDAARRDFSDAVPKPRHRFWIWMAAAPAAVALVLLALYPAAATNAWARFLAPWRDSAALHLRGSSSRCPSG